MIFVSEISNSNFTFHVTWSLLYVLGIEILRGTVPGSVLAWTLPCIYLPKRVL